MIGVNEKEILDTFINVNIQEHNIGKVNELLTRMGIMNKLKNELYQTCHLFKKAGNLYIVHFKEMYEINGRESTFDENDKNRRDKIALLLESYELIEINNPEVVEDSYTRIDIIPFKDKSNFVLKRKYSFDIKNSRYYKNPSNCFGYENNR